MTVAFPRKCNKMRIYFIRISHICSWLSFSFNSLFLSLVQYNSNFVWNGKCCFICPLLIDLILHKKKYSVSVVVCKPHAWKFVERSYGFRSLTLVSCNHNNNVIEIKKNRISQSERHNGAREEETESTMGQQNEMVLLVSSCHFLCLVRLVLQVAHFAFDYTYTGVFFSGSLLYWILCTSVSSINACHLICMLKQ